MFAVRTSSLKIVKVLLQGLFPGVMNLSQNFEIVSDLSSDEPCSFRDMGLRETFPGNWLPAVRRWLQLYSAICR